MVDNTDRYLNLITRFNNIVRYNDANNIPPSRELLVAQDYIRNKVDASNLLDPYLNKHYLNELSKNDKSAYDFISKLLN